eukprot:COSAG06_NODE_6416_length_2942_cov_1.688709_2_plen_90_part_00
MLTKATPREVDRPYYSQPPHPTPPPSDDINRFSWSLKAAIETSRAIRAQRVLELQLSPWAFQILGDQQRMELPRGEAATTAAPAKEMLS